MNEDKIYNEELLYMAKRILLNEHKERSLNWLNNIFLPKLKWFIIGICFGLFISTILKEFIK